jgi:indolepyruvate ferredoxin oxidoreductase alpha subunit
MKKFLVGNEAIARGAYEAGVRVATAHPGSPTTEIVQYLSKYEEINAEWSINEKVALEIALGASIGGVRTLCSMKQVGLNVAADPLFNSSYTGVNGGLVIVVGDDPGIFGSQNEQDSRLYGKAAKIPILEPANGQECKSYTKLAFEISEKYDTPVMIRITTRVANCYELVEIEDRVEQKIKEYKKDINKYVLFPPISRRKHEFVEKRKLLLEKCSNQSFVNRVIKKDSSFGIISSGISIKYSIEAFPEASILEIGMSFPLPKDKVREFCSFCKKVYVVEELEPFLEEEIKNLGLKVIGKDLLPITGELSTEIIKNKIIGVKETPIKGEEDLTSNQQTICVGCSYRAVSYVLKKLDLIVFGDTGCNTLTSFEPFGSMDTCICMGASIGMIQGIQKVRNENIEGKAVAVIGDSSFFHSGLTSLINLIHNKGFATVIILDNSITAMSGQQDNPGNEFTIKGEFTCKVDIEKIVRAIKIENVYVIDPIEVEEFEKILKNELGEKKPSVIICKSKCLKKYKSKEKRKLFVNSVKCKRCRKCFEIHCQAIEIRNDYIQINKDLCVGCGLCKNVCKFNAIEIL